MPNDDNPDHETNQPRTSDDDASSMRDLSEAGVTDPLITSLLSRRKKHAKNLFIAHVNVNSLAEKRDYFRDILSKKLVDVLCITETKLCDSYVYEDFHVDGYKVHRKDHSSNSGGLLVWARADLPHYRDTAYELSNVTDCHVESIVLNFTIRKEQWFLILTYKNPRVTNGVFVNLLSTFYQSVLANGKTKEIILLGDININMLKVPNIITNELCDIYGLHNLVDGPTCFKSVDGTLLDPIFVLNRHRFEKCINVTCGYSDWHNLTCCITKLEMPAIKSKTVMYRSYKKFDATNFANDMSMVPFHVSQIFEDVSDQYWCVTQLYSEVLNDHAPEKKRVIKSTQVPYMNSELRKQMYRRSMARNKYLRSRDHHTWDAYTAERNKTTNMRRQAIRSYFVQKCTNMSRPNDFWDCVKPLMSAGSKHRQDIILQEDQHIITDHGEVCEILNKFFTSVASDIGGDDGVDLTSEDWWETIQSRHQHHPSVTKIADTHPAATTFKFRHVTHDEVLRYLQRINPKKATGHDGIPPGMVKSTQHEVAGMLTAIFNNSFDCRVYPQDMKYAEITSVHKKGNNMDKANYRPISILTTFSKVLETIIADQLVMYFNQLFHDLLCAYRKKYGTCHSLVSLLESWKQALDNNQCVGALLMDLSKAFDCVPHGLLLCKLKAYGLHDDACVFIGNYLSGRQQRVKINTSRSTWRTLSKGIPQGSCLGPVIFNIFTNDLFHFICHTKLANYADDNTLSTTAPTLDLITAALAYDADNAIQWFAANFMRANPQKFQMIYMVPLNSILQIPEVTVINEVSIPTETHVKLLGITIDNKLTFDRHVDNICRRASQQLNVLRRFKSMFRLREAKLIHQAFIMSNFNYCPVVWHFCSLTSTRKMEKIQERALRLLYDDPTTPYQELLTSHGHTTLHIQRLRTIALEVFKSLHDLNPAFMKDMFEEKTVQYGLRDTQKLTQPKYRTIRYGRNTLTYYGAHLWNLLPSHIKLTCDINLFKSMICSWDGPSCCCSLCGFT